MTARYKHGPGCYACTDPAGAARQIAGERAELRAQAQAAREHRAAGEAMRDRWYKQHELSDEDWDAVQFVTRSHLEAANVLACDVRFARARLKRVLDAHPDVQRALEGAAA